MLLSVLLAGTSGAEGAGSEVTAWVRAARGLTDRTREVRLRGRAEAAAWAVLVRRRGRARDETRVGFAIPVAGGRLLLGNQLRATSSPGRGWHDPLAIRRGAAAPSLSLGRSPVGASWSRATPRADITLGLERSAGGRAALGARARWGGAELAATWRERRSTWAAAWCGKAQGLPVRVESSCDDSARGLRIGAGESTGGLTAEVRLAEGRRHVVLRGGMFLLGRLRVTGTVRPDAGEPGRELGWALSWARTRRGGRLRADLAEAAGALRLRAGAERVLGPHLRAEASAQAPSGHRRRQLMVGLRFVSRPTEGGARIELLPDRTRRASARVSRILPGGSRLRASAGWQRGRAPTLELEWGAVPVGPG